MGAPPNKSVTKSSNKKKTGVKSSLSKGSAAPKGFDVPALRAGEIWEETPPLEEKVGAAPKMNDETFEEWTDSTLKSEDWHNASKIFVDDSIAGRALPMWIKECEWCQASEVLRKRLEKQDHKEDEAKEKAKGKKAPNDKKKAGWTESEFDAESGHVLPRLVVTENWPVNESHGLKRIRADDSTAASVLRLISTFGGSPWTAIYPQDASGRPCYNPGNKYLLRIWMRGKWCKLVVDGNIPIDEDDLPTICYSVEARELWPCILTKALYKLSALLNNTNLLQIGLNAFVGWELIASHNTHLTLDSLEHLPRFTRKEITLEATARWIPPVKRAPKSDLSTRRRKRYPDKEPSEEQLNAAVESRNAAITAVYSQLMQPRERVFALASGTGVLQHFYPVLGILISDKEEQQAVSIITDWHCDRAQPEHFGPPEDVTKEAPAPAFNCIAIKDEHLIELSTLLGLEYTESINSCWHYLPDDKQKELVPSEPLEPTLLLLDTVEDDHKAPLLLTVDSYALLDEEGSSEFQVKLIEEKKCESEALTLQADPSHCNRYGDVAGSIFRVQLQGIGQARFVSSAPLRIMPLADQCQTARGDHPSLTDGEEIIIFRRYLKKSADLELWLSNKESTGIIFQCVDSYGFSSDLSLRQHVCVTDEALLLVARLRGPVQRGRWILFAQGEDAQESMLTEVDETSPPVMVTYHGAYSPNAESRLFREVLEASSDCLPMQIELGFDAFDVHVKVYELDKSRLIHVPATIEAALKAAKVKTGAAGCRLVAEGSGRGLIRLPCISTLQNSDEEELVAFVIEAYCVSPVQTQQLPPHTYNSAQNTVEDADTSSAWELKIVAARDEIQLQPDYSAELARFSLRQAWETAEPGRAARAAAVLHATTAVVESVPANTTAKASTKKRATTADMIAEALGPKFVDTQLQAERERIRKSLPSAFVQTGDTFVTQQEEQNLGAEETFDAFMQKIEKRTADCLDQEAKHAREIGSWREDFIESSTALLHRREKYRLQREEYFEQQRKLAEAEEQNNQSVAAPRRRSSVNKIHPKNTNNSSSKKK